MGRVETLRNEIARLQKVEADLRKDVSKAEGVAASARAASSKKRSDPLRTKSDTSHRSYIRSAEAEDKKLVTAEKKIADLKAKLARNTRDQAAKQKSLSAAKKTISQAAGRALTKRRQEDIKHAREVSRLTSPTVRYVEVPAPKPEKLRVLYLTSNPEATETEYTTPDGVAVKESYWLRTEAEVRQVKQAYGARNTATSSTLNTNQRLRFRTCSTASMTIGHTSFIFQAMAAVDQFTWRTAA